MEAIFFWLWVILIVIFSDYFWLITISLIIFYLILQFIPKIINNYREEKRYHKILKELMPKVKNINLKPYQSTLSYLENIYKTTYYETTYKYKVRLEDKDGNAINICPKCGEYMCIRRGWWRDPFLGCTNYPNCRFTRDYEEIFKIKI